MLNFRGGPVPLVYPLNPRLWLASNNVFKNFVPVLELCMDFEYPCKVVILNKKLNIILLISQTFTKLYLMQILNEECKKFRSTFYLGTQKWGINCHNLLPLCGDVENWGPLWAFSYFWAEDLNGKIWKFVHGTRNTYKQVN